jgi:outer membrane protein assembly factor BamB
LQATGATRDRVVAGIPAKPKDRRRRSSLPESFAADGAIRWQTDLGESNKFEAISIAVCPNAIVAVIQQQQKFRAQPQWYAVAFNATNGQQMWRNEIRENPLPGGLLVDREGQVVVTMLSGNVLCLTGG